MRTTYSKRSLAGLATLAVLASRWLPAARRTMRRTPAPHDQQLCFGPQARRGHRRADRWVDRHRARQGLHRRPRLAQAGPWVTGAAKLTGGALVFPITGGNVTIFKPGAVSPYVIGQIQHVGSGLSLTAGQTKVTLTNLNVDPGVSRVYGDVAVNGKTAVQSAFLFQLDGRTLKPLATEGSNAVLEGTKVMISPDAAGLLNDTFKTDAVKAGLLVGIAKISVATK